MIGMPGVDSGARRARWLAELAEALDDAHLLVAQLAIEKNGYDPTALSARIEAARLEVHSLRLKRSSGGRQDFDPEWSKDIPWKLSA